MAFPLGDMHGPGPIFDEMRYDVFKITEKEDPMPLLKMHTSVPVPEDKKEGLVKALSKITAETIGKPESYVMVVLSDGTMSMGGELGPAAFADVRSIGGLSGGVNKEISNKVCGLLKDTLGIPGNRVYLSFTDSAAADWGWDSGTFG
jgi:phenylpyruvate tautomerase PptA (4-oxalocrotonate tautomerase family)